MIPCKPTTSKLKLFLLSFIVFSTIHVSAQDGKALFNSKCASCHNVFKDVTGPKLGGVSDNEYYGGDMKKLYEWIRNAASMANTVPHYVQLKAQFGSVMTSFPDLTDAEIDAIFNHINTTFAAGQNTQKPGGETAAASEESSNQNAIIFGVISLILAIIALILMQVNSNLKKMSDDAEGIERPEPVPFFKNKIYIAMLAIVFFMVGGYFIAKGAIGLQRQTNYQPEQPIFYSHKVHAGINQINCLYCHGNAWESKSAAIPSVNVCMNCHKTITSYSENSPKLYDKNGREVNGTAEIAKLHKYAGFDPQKPNAWDPSKSKPIEWVKIHNLPDHVYFSHAQHVKAGNVQCQTCHGNIPEMHEVKQASELSMGWCINCHRTTKVQFNYDSTKGNKFYSLYEKFHRDLKADTVFDDNGDILKIYPAKMDSITVKDIGGLECQKCHY